MSSSGQSEAGAQGRVTDALRRLVVAGDVTMDWNFARIRNFA